MTAEEQQLKSHVSDTDRLRQITEIISDLKTDIMFSKMLINQDYKGYENYDNIISSTEVFKNTLLHIEDRLKEAIEIVPDIYKKIGQERLQKGVDRLEEKSE